MYYLSCECRDSLNPFDCGKTNQCDTVNKVELLARDILSKDYIYVLFPDDLFRINYLNSDGHIKPGRVFIGRDSIPVVSLPNDTNKHKGFNKIYIYNIRSNFDTTNINLKLVYLLYGRYVRKEIDFHYMFDINNCNWILKDSSIRYY